MAVQTAAGAKLYIGPADDSASSSGDYIGLSYDEVAEIEDIGEFGDSVNEVTFTALSDRRVRKFKGSFDAGTLELTLGRDPSDDGQGAMIDALASDDDYAFKVELNDAEGSGDPTTFFFRGKVMSYTAQIGNTENVVRASASIAINSEIIEVPAT